MNRVSNDRDNKELKFLNERVVKYRKEDIIRLILLVVLCAVFLGVVLCAAFFRTKPFFSDYFSKSQKNKQQGIPSTVQDEYNPQDAIVSETICTTEKMQTSGSKNDTEPIEPVTIEDMYRSVVTIVSGDCEKRTEDSLNSEYITSGLVIYKGEDIVILTSYDKVKGFDVVDVYFDRNNSYTGRVKSLSMDYKIAIITVKKQDMPESDFKKIRPAVLAGDEAYYISEQITFIGHLLEKKKLMANGSLTLIGNTVSIMDAEVEIFATDIAKAGEVNGFAFNEMGHVMGMVIEDISGNDFGDNKLLLIRISDLEPYIERMLNNRQIPYIGIYGREVTDEVIKNIDNEMPYGIYISNRKENSPAYLAGIMNGDVLVAIDDRKILNFDDYIKSLHENEVGQEIIVTVMRKGKDGYKQIKYTVKVDGR